jgi:hypothetical protein
VAVDAFSSTVDRLLHLIRPHGRRQTCFPPSLDPGATRLGPNESLHSWYARIVADYCGDEPMLWAIEPNVAAFIALFWNTNQLYGANISTLITSCDLEEYLLGPPPECEYAYFRLDLDVRSLGQPFSHPLPHIHVIDDLSPRFAVEIGPSGNVVMDYFDFIYRQYVPSKWRDWAEAVWNHRVQPDPLDNPFPTIVAAFERGEIGVLREHAQSVQRLKQILSERKDELFEYCMSPEDLTLLRYPA